MFLHDYLFIQLIVHNYIGTTKTKKKLNMKCFIVLQHHNTALKINFFYLTAHFVSLSFLKRSV